MKFCKYCGNEVNDGEKFCQKCGAKIEETEVNNDPIKNNETIRNTENYNNVSEGESKTNAAAIGSLVCSLVGILVAGIPLGIVAICLSATAKKHMSVFPNEKGKGLATAGLIIGIIDIVFAFIGVIKLSLL